MDSDNKHKILLVDDDSLALEALEALFDDDYIVIAASSGAEVIEKVESIENIAAVIMDIKMPGMDGITAARKIRSISPILPVIFHTGYPGDYDEDEIDENEKPFGYVQKAGPTSRLIRAVRNAVEAYKAHVDIKELTRQAQSAYGIIGQSEPMIKVFQLIRKTASTDTKVMILGETGTGKELIVRAIYNLSPRHENRLVIFNCNHKSIDLVESELFGHKKGSFTGAVNDRVGLFEYADKGTIFLDEIGDLDITTQAKLLRVLETGEFSIIGSSETVTTDVRLICATHKNLSQMVAEGKFREDLYYRLKGIQIVLPSLKERKEDIPLLINKFADRFTVESDRSPVYFDKSAINVMLDYDWPGNVRQLLDTVESLITLSDSDIIIGADVEQYLGLDSSHQAELSGKENLSQRVRQFRKNCIIEALHETGNVINSAARLLGVDPANLRKWIKNYNIQI